ncbi:Glucan endo-1,3-beta-glucosidase [Melia azedarach]|uniref:Glucan endo-1,3-beta-glucosidase n=1 Tax=Melia azedarach TaxID=155640 RepID=A0ACC1YZW2_MELAZ|nr:Glucan endo-1,3-beta-glucosidase [Melia azedarach]
MPVALVVLIAPQFRPVEVVTIPTPFVTMPSYAFNQYYQKNPIPSSCNFGGTAVTTSTDPSTGTCQYPSTSTSASILNTTNSNGATVYGAVRPNPPSPITSAAAATRLSSMPVLFPVLCFLMLQLVDTWKKLNSLF